MNLFNRPTEYVLPKCLSRSCVLLTMAVSVISGCGFNPLSPASQEIPLVPVNVAPTAEAKIENGTNVTFEWKAAQFATYYEFHIFDRSNSDISKYYRRNLRASSVCNGGTCRLNETVTMPIMKSHAWRVRAGNVNGLSGWNRNLFDMVGAGDTLSSRSSNETTVPNPINPLVGAAVQENSLVDFVWSPAPEATSYDFHLFDSANQVIVDQLVDIPAGTVCQDEDFCQLTRTVSLPPAGDHAWRVRAVGSTGPSAWTRVVFSVVR